MSHKTGVKSGVKIYGPYGDVYHYPTTQGLSYIRRMVGWGWPVAAYGTESGIMTIHFPLLNGGVR